MDRQNAVGNLPLCFQCQSQYLLYRLSFNHQMRSEDSAGFFQLFTQYLSSMVKLLSGELSFTLPFLQLVIDFVDGLLNSAGVLLQGRDGLPTDASNGRDLDCFKGRSKGFFSNNDVLLLNVHGRCDGIQDGSVEYSLLLLLLFRFFAEPFTPTEAPFQKLFRPILVVGAVLWEENSGKKNSVL